MNVSPSGKATQPVDPRADLPVGVRFDARPDPHLLDFLTILARVKWVVFGCILAGAAVAIVLTSTLPFVYESHAVLLPPDRISSSALGLNLKSSGGALKMLKAVENPSVDLMQNLLEARDVARRIGEDSAINSYYTTYVAPTGEFLNRTEWVQSTLLVVPSITMVKVNTTVSTSWSAGPAEKEACRLISARIANVGTRELIRYFDGELQSSAAAARALAESNLADRERALDSVSAAREAFEREHHVAALPVQIKALIRGESELRAKLENVQIKAAVLERRATTAQPEVQDLRATAAATEAALADYRSANNGGLGVEGLPEVSRKLAEYEARITQLEPVVTFLRQEVEQERINERRESGVIQVLDPALPPVKKSSPKRSVILLLGLTIGAVVAATYVIFRTFVQDVRTNGIRAYQQGAAA
jgi:uncharacterized protein involved in exopolysaccharide biosynthesis